MARRLRNLLCDVAVFDMPTIAGASGLLMLVVFAASLVPARRA